LAIQVDVSNKASVAGLLGAAVARFKRIDVLFK